jgi:hypothetical protein
MFYLLFIDLSAKEAITISITLMAFLLSVYALNAKFRRHFKNDLEEALGKKADKTYVDELKEEVDRKVDKNVFNVELKNIADLLKMQTKRTDKLEDIVESKANKSVKLQNEHFIMIDKKLSDYFKLFLDVLKETKKD